MSGPVLVIELAAAVPATAIDRLRELLVRSPARFEEEQVGKYDDLNVYAESLGMPHSGGVDPRRCRRTREGGLGKISV
ncbi:hypothetical protein ACFC09_32615 [Streptomyces sp. NPDC056161]|uniref:hypothetical protein n=1 Tax=Streptomyces sp. NPDC056161 TaxID=3345732 RepID=UPI0035DBE221